MNQDIINLLNEFCDTMKLVERKINTDGKLDKETSLELLTGFREKVCNKISLGKSEEQLKEINDIIDDTMDKLNKEEQNKDNVP